MIAMGSSAFSARSVLHHAATAGRVDELVTLPGRGPTQQPAHIVLPAK